MAFWVKGMWDLSSLTSLPSLNHWTAKEFPKIFNKIFLFKIILKYFEGWNKFKTRFFVHSFACLLKALLHKYFLNAIYLLKSLCAVLC